ncbi:MAG: hypothetical protein EBT02_11445 [Planctomycetia bacterium]|nr:hypothetical protein [Planctomycetia bacterium]
MSFSPSVTASSAGIALRSCPFSALRDVVLEEIGERVIIHGTVNSYYLKQIAQEAIKNLGKSNSGDQRKSRLEIQLQASSYTIND